MGVVLLIAGGCVRMGLGDGSLEAYCTEDAFAGEEWHYSCHLSDSFGCGGELVDGMEEGASRWGHRSVESSGM